MGVWGQGGTTDFQGYDYVQTAQPAEPEEGQTWYDLDADSALVYDGANWVEMTVTDHAQLSGVTADAHHAKTTSAAALSDVSADSVTDAHHTKTTSAAALSDVSADSVADAHHPRYTDNEAIQATDGVIDAETVDGKHASDLATPASTNNGYGFVYVGPDESAGESGSGYWHDGTSGAQEWTGHYAATDRIQVTVTGIPNAEVTSIEVRDAAGNWSTEHYGFTSGQTVDVDFSPLFLTGVRINWTNNGSARDEPSYSFYPYRKVPVSHDHGL